MSHESHAPHRGRGPGRPFNPPEGRLSESVAKARIAPERRRRIVDIPRFFSRPIPVRGAFATDLDNRPPRTVPGAPTRTTPRPPIPAAATTPDPRRLFRGGFEDVGREGRGGGLLGRGPPRPEGYCEGVRVRLPGVTRGVVEGVGARGSAVTARSSRLRVRRGAGGCGGIGGPGVGGGPGGVGGGSGAPSPLRLDSASRMVGRRLACRDEPRPARSSPNPRARRLTREIVT